MGVSSVDQTFSCSANVGCFATSSVGKKKHFSLASKFVILRPAKPYSWSARPATAE